MKVLLPLIRIALCLTILAGVGCAVRESSTGLELSTTGQQRYQLASCRYTNGEAFHSYFTTSEQLGSAGIVDLEAHVNGNFGEFHSGKLTFSMHNPQLTRSVESEGWLTLAALWDAKGLQSIKRKFVRGLGSGRGYPWSVSINAKLNMMKIELLSSPKQGAETFESSLVILERCDFVSSFLDAIGKKTKSYVVDVLSCRGPYPMEIRALQDGKGQWSLVSGVLAGEPSDVLFAGGVKRYQSSPHGFDLILEGGRYKAADGITESQLFSLHGFGSYPMRVQIALSHMPVKTSSNQFQITALRQEQIFQQSCQLRN